MRSFGEFSAFPLNENLNKKSIILKQKNENSIKVLFISENAGLEIYLRNFRQKFVLEIKAKK